MSLKFLEFSDALLQSRQVDPVQIKQTMEVFFTLSNCASQTLDKGSYTSGGEQDWGNEKLSSLISSASETKALQMRRTSVSMHGYAPKTELLTSPPQKRNDHDNNVTENIYHVGPTVPDPYRNYLWDRPLNSSTDGTSALPYILAGRDSFASRLYFETIVMAVRALRGEGLRSIVNSMFRWKRQYTKIEYILGVTSGVLNMMLHGTSQDPKEGQVKVFPEPDGPEQSTIKRAIAKDLIAEGFSEKEYLNTWSVERYLRDTWGLVVSSTIVRASSAHLRQGNEITGGPIQEIPFAPTMIPGFAHSEASLLDAQVLVERLVLGAVTLGEGPRWHFSFVDHVAESFLQDPSTEEACADPLLG